MNLAPLVRATNVGPLVLYRAAPPVANAYGGFDASAPATLSLEPVTVHTASGRDLDQLPEADRTRETVQIHTLEALHVADGDQAADRLVYQARVYRVVHVEDYSRMGGVWISLGVLEEA